VADKTLTFRLIGDPTSFNAAMLSASASSSRLAKNVGTSTTQANKGLSGLTKNLGILPSGFALAAGAGAAAGLAIGKAVKVFAEFDEAMSAVGAATGATGEELDSLGEAALSAAADTKFGATDAARGIEALGKAGIETSDIIGGGLKGALDLAAAGEIEVASAAEVAASAMTQFGLSGADVPHIADLIAAAAGKAQGSVDDMAQAMSQSGLVASQMGLSIEETTGTLAAFASAGLTSSDAGTSFRTMLLRLANPIGKAAAEMERLGISAFDSQGAFVGMEALAGNLQAALANMTQEQRTASLAIIFGQDAIRGANVLFAEGASGIAEWTAKVDDSGFAAEQADERTKNLKGDLEKLGGAVEAMGIQIGRAADGPLRKLSQVLEDQIESITEWNAKTDQATEDAGISWSNIGDSIGGALETADEVMDKILEDIGIELPDMIGRNEEPLTGFAGWLERTREEQGRLAVETDRLTGQAALYAEQTARGTSAIQLQAEELAGLQQAYLDTANAILGLSNANIGYEQAVDDAAESVKEHGETLDITTEAGRRNQTALDGIAGSALRVIQQMRETGAAESEVTAKSATMRDALIAAGIRFGKTEAEAAAYADSILAIPRSANTNVTVSGAAQATRLVEDLRAAVLRLPSGKTIRISYVSTVTGATVGSGITRADGGIIPGYPAGGLVRGIGGPRQDLNLAAVSAGEFVVNAADTARNRGVLEHINSGGRLGGGQSTVFEFRSDGSRAGDLLVELFRKTIRVKGGNVQTVLGAG
jgi:TP901 family phage tail tape measure protein